MYRKSKDDTVTYYDCDVPINFVRNKQPDMKIVESTSNRKAATRISLPKTVLSKHGRTAYKRKRGLDDDSLLEDTNPTTEMSYRGRLTDLAEYSM